MTSRPSPGEGEEILFGIHPLEEALANRRRWIGRVLVAREHPAGRLGRLLKMAREAGIPVSHLPRSVLARKAGRRAAHQGVAALVSAVPYADPEEVVAVAERPDGLLLALDRVQDPRNLGAVIRTAAAAGAQGILISPEGTVGLTPIVAKTSAGALERVPVAREPRLAERLGSLRQGGFRVLGLDPRGGTPWGAATLTGRIALVAGGEARGPRRAVLQACQETLAIPLVGGVESLNVAVAVGVVLFEAVRQRGGPTCEPARGREPGP